MGVTGSGKTFTMANVIQQLQRPTLVLSHNKTLAAQLYSEFKEFFPHNAVQLLRQLLRLLPARSVHPAARHLHRERRLDQRGDRPPAAGGDQRAGQPPGRDHRRQRVVHLRLGLAGRLQGDDGRRCAVGEVVDRDALLAQAGRHPVRAQRHRSFARQVPRARRFASRSGPPTRSSPTASSSGATRSSSCRSSIPPTGETIDKLDADLHLPGQALRHAGRADRRRRRCRSARNCDDRLRTVQAARQAARSPAAQRAHAVRPRDDARGGLLPRHRELQPAALAAGRPASPPYTLFDFFPDDFLLIIDESHVTVPQVRAMYAGDRSRKKTLVEHGFRLPSALDNRPLKFDEWRAAGQAGRCTFRRRRARTNWSKRAAKWSSR